MHQVLIMAFVYIIQSLKTGRYYIGSTTNYVKRLQAHNNGRVYSTKSYRPFVVKLIQKYASLSQARKIEYRLKALKRKDYLDKIVNEGIIKMSL